MSTPVLYGRQGWGSVLIEAQLIWYEIDYEFREVGDLFEDASARRSLEKINPVAQVPTLILPDGTAMTESAAITLWLAEQTDREDLVPEVGNPDRASFLRWLVFIVANIYPTYTYADDPSRFVPDAPAREGFKQQVVEYAKRMYRVLDEAAVGPWFLGERFSAIDIFVCALSHWRPGPAWFERETPTLISIATATKAQPRLAKIWAQNYPPT
ncbi:MAG: glutathione S-transferase family protein [Myxococcota bacterium]